MTASNRAAGQLQLYREYSDKAHRTSGGISEAFGCMARDALQKAAKLDPAAVATAKLIATAHVLLSLASVENALALWADQVERECATH
jgi:hypothetical protein